MDTRRLSYFVRIAEDGSLTKAAGMLRIAQPALSRQIRLLEEELGVSLFSRTARGMQLTAEGEFLRASVAGPLREMELALQNVRSIGAKLEGDCAIGMPSSIGDALSRPLALRMDAELPHIKLKIVEGITGSLIDWLIRGMVDFALVEEPSRDQRLTHREILAEKLVLIGAVDAKLKPDKPINFAEAARLPLILPSHHLGIRGTLNDAAAEARVTFNIRMEADSTRLVKSLLENGMGYTIMPPAYFKRELEEGRFSHCPIVKPVLPLSIYLSRRSHNLANPSLANLVENKIAEVMAETF